MIATQTARHNGFGTEQLTNVAFQPAAKWMAEAHDMADFMHEGGQGRDCMAADGGALPPLQAARATAKRGKAEGTAHGRLRQRASGDMRLSRFCLFVTIAARRILANDAQSGRGRL